MTDILPTGWSVAWNAWRLLGIDLEGSEDGGGKGRYAEGVIEGEEGERVKRGVCVVIGCGPVSSGSPVSCD
jgi:hypothetical protein